MLQTVVIKNTIIYPFTGSTFAVDSLVFFGISWNAGLKTKITVILNIYRTAIITRRTSPSVRAGVNAAAFIGAAVFMGILSGVIAPWTHFMSGFAQRMPGFVKSDVIRSIFRRFGTAVDVNQCIDIHMLKQFISGYIVMCGIKADIFGSKTISMTAKIIKGIQKVFAVMPAGLSKFHEDGKFRFKLVISAAEHI